MFNFSNFDSLSIKNTHTHTHYTYALFYYHCFLIGVIIDIYYILIHWTNTLEAKINCMVFFFVHQTNKLSNLMEFATK